jgi:hypothetical protein
MSSKKQKADIEAIVEQAGKTGIRTEQVKIDGMYKGVSCADRYLRWLREDGKVVFEKKPNDKTKTWYSTKYAPEYLTEE